MIFCAAICNKVKSASYDKQGYDIPPYSANHQERFGCTQGERLYLQLDLQWDKEQVSLGQKHDVEEKHRPIEDDTYDKVS